jgi:CDP-glucose 4,6-dehydratase
MNNFKNFYKNKKIFITGHTGFKGTWLTSTLIEFGSKVMGYSINDERKKIFHEISNHNKVSNVYADILDYNYLNKKILEFNPEIIFHLAAQSIVSESYKSPLRTVKTNIDGTLNILEISRKIKNLKSLVIITSDKCYLNKEFRRGYKESDELGGEDLYSASKASAELIFNAYSHSFLIHQKKFGFATARAGNVIGGGDWSANRIIPDCVRSIKKKSNLIIRNPNSTRPWQHVLEPISGYLLLAKKLYENNKKFNGSWNFGPSVFKSMKVKDVVKLFYKYIGFEKKVIFKKADFKETNLLKLNSNKALKYLNWKNTWDMKKSVVKTADWYSSYLKKKNLKKITSLQIREYFKLND